MCHYKNANFRDADLIESDLGNWSIEGAKFVTVHGIKLLLGQIEEIC